MKIIKLIFLILILLNFTNLNADQKFDQWLVSFSDRAKNNGISQKTINQVLKKATFLPNVIKYDRYQPEFYEDTNTYISKRVNNKKINKGINLYKKNSTLIKKVENNFNVEKELLLALMGIETNYGNYLGKMDIISSLATLSYDQRRSDFFSNELLIILKLIDENLIDHNILFGSWAGAFGNFQFMPSTIKDYAIDYDKNNLIDLMSNNDSFASAANYINKMGWKKKKHCFKRVNLSNNIPTKFLNTSARNLHSKKKLSFYKKYITNFESLNIDQNVKVAIITPDKDIVNNADIYSPAYLVFSNYEIILKWNRSLRFALAVCSLKNKLEDKLNL